MARGRAGKGLGVGGRGESIDGAVFEELSEGGELSAGTDWSDILKRLWRSIESETRVSEGRVRESSSI